MKLENDLLIRKVAIIYCTSQTYTPGRANEKKADCEVIEVAQAVKTALETYGCSVDLVDLDCTRLAELRQYGWVFNLAETVNGFPLSEYEVAEELENLNIYFTGSGSLALKNCLDKAATKAELLRHGIPTPAYAVLPPGSRVLKRLPFPLMVKPVHEDGSIGITRRSIVHTPAELERQVQHIHTTYQQPALVEEYIAGRDITASILGNGGEAEVLPLSEIRYTEAEDVPFQTFAAKWECESAEYQHSLAQCPCDLEPDVEGLVKEMAVCAYQVMGCRDYARVDFRLWGNQPYVLEVNPNPCINPVDTGFVRCCEAGGYGYRQMAIKILTNSIKNYTREPALLRDWVAN